MGDVGHTPGTLRLLERYIPGAQVILWHQDPEAYKEMKAAKEMIYDVLPDNIKSKVVVRDTLLKCVRSDVSLYAFTQHVWHGAAFAYHMYVKAEVHYGCCERFGASIGLWYVIKMGITI